MYGIVRDKFLSIPSTSEKEGVMIRPNFGLVTGLAIYKAYIFGDDVLVVPSSTLLCFGLLKTFILSSSLTATKFFGYFQMIVGMLNAPDVLRQYEIFLQMFPPIKFPRLYCQQYGNNVAVMSPISMPGQACEESWYVPVHGKGELHRYKATVAEKTLLVTFISEVCIAYMNSLLNEVLFHEELFYLGVFT